MGQDNTKQRKESPGTLLENVRSEGASPRWGCKLKGLPSQFISSGNDVAYVDYSYFDVYALLSGMEKETFGLMDLLFSLFYHTVINGATTEQVAKTARQRALHQTNHSENPFSPLSTIVDGFEGGTEYMSAVESNTLKHLPSFRERFTKDDLEELVVILSLGGENGVETKYLAQNNTSGAQQGESLLPSLVSLNPLASAYSSHVSGEDVSGRMVAGFSTKEANILPLFSLSTPSAPAKLGEVERSSMRSSSPGVVANIHLSYHPNNGGRV